MKSFLGLIALLPVLVNATITSPNNLTIVKSIINLKKIGVNTSSIINELSDKTKEELLNTIPIEIQSSDNLEIIDLRSLENDLKISIHDTIGP